MTNITTRTRTTRVLMPSQPNKDEASRLAPFIDWLDEHQQDWHQPNLAAYRDHLLNDYQNPRRTRQPGLAPSSVATHLATIRGRYQQLLRDNDIRQELYNLAPAASSPADKAAFVNELLARVQNAIHHTTAPVRVIQRQDEADGHHIRLTGHQLTALLQAPGIDTLLGLRDTAILALLAMTGIRESELVALDVDDLRQHYDGALALHVRDGKGGKARLVPYGAGDWCLAYVDAWLAAAGITSGAVFRGLYKGGKVRPNRITTRAINKLMLNYHISIDGQQRAVKPHDLRRTYAKLLHDGGMSIQYIASNLGHASIETTSHYIGRGDGHQRQPSAVIQPPHKLASLTRLV